MANERTTLEDIALSCNGILNALYDQDQGIYIAKLLLEQLQTDIAKKTALLQSPARIEFMDIHKKTGYQPLFFTLSELLSYVSTQIQVLEKSQVNRAQINNPGFGALSTVRRPEKK